MFYNVSVSKQMFQNSKEEKTMKKAKTVIKGILMSTVTLGVGFLALALPFRMFTGLSAEEMHILFVAELAVYFVTGIVYLIFQDRKQKEKEKNEERRIARRAKFQQAQKEYYDLAA